MRQRTVTAVASLGAAIALVVISACGQPKPPVAVPPPAPPPPVVVDNHPPPPPPPPPYEVPPPVPPPPALPTEEEIFARTSLEALNSQHPLDDVFFEYDKSDMSDAARAALQKDSAWMKKWTSTRVTIEGHADSRGTAEYNLALGERRGAAARDYLVSLGIDVSRISVVSKGKEQPFCAEETESCWSQNRRGHFIVVVK